MVAAQVRFTLPPKPLTEATLMVSVPLLGPTAYADGHDGGIGHEREVGLGIRNRPRRSV